MGCVTTVSYSVLINRWLVMEAHVFLIYFLRMIVCYSVKLLSQSVLPCRMRFRDMTKHMVKESIMKKLGCSSAKIQRKKQRTKSNLCWGGKYLGWKVSGPSILYGKVQNSDVRRNQGESVEEVTGLEGKIVVQGGQRDID